MTHIVPLTNYIWAVPFPIKFNGKAYIFIEQQIGTGNSILGVIELFPNLTYSALTPILKKLLTFVPQYFLYNRRQ
ncbi:hypothetical protein TREAZ_0680 [Leadbettera azotonutricia ZAS-9]|uniref:Uncharacterized protein n=1 Tax=Leadbettera azotonutricia (strain ATCC BAA-888 / DSM 13862 / ZAS-9) TaxID=545695 RepID=F5YAV1_LEAAZ|nr:hypothetical protein TREAZ_0680 [Leadbettera azotonutricia ZAS-9]